jgi:hypothetical protein
MPLGNFHWIPGPDKRNPPTESIFQSLPNCASDGGSCLSCQQDRVWDQQFSNTSNLPVWSDIFRMK